MNLLLDLFKAIKKSDELDDLLGNSGGGDNPPADAPAPDATGDEGGDKPEGGEKKEDEGKPINSKPFEDKFPQYLENRNIRNLDALKSNTIFYE